MMFHQESEANIVVMAKPAVPGRVKTRLFDWLSPYQAAQVHAAMLECVLERVAAYVPNTLEAQLYLAFDCSMIRGHAKDEAVEVYVGPRWQVIDQGQGDLGERLAFVWRLLGDQQIVFLGGDSPDVPTKVLRGILPELTSSEAAIGPVWDGGYWALACRFFQPRLVEGIDWGSSRVYHQTLSIAKDVGLKTVSLARWYDIDHPSDLRALRRRITGCDEPELIRLNEKINVILQDRIDDELT